MTRSERMKPIQDIAESRELDAARRLREAQRIYAKQQEYLEALRHYRKTYAEETNQPDTNVMDARKLRNYRAFLSHLNDSILRQEAAVDSARSRCDQVRQGWVAEHQRHRALDKVVDRLRDQERAAANRKEQRESDECALRLLSRPQPRS
ncbi:MAG: flagellar export protein FliJ [Pseudomonadota bacterium]|nr:flagellar export protein FliJ [Pseudomonadota bacterium]